MKPRPKDPDPSSSIDERPKPTPAQVSRPDSSGYAIGLPYCLSARNRTRSCRNECVAYSWEFRSNAAAHGRNQQHLLDLSAWLIQHGIGFIVLEQAIDTTARSAGAYPRFGCQQMPKFSGSPIARPGSSTGRQRQRSGVEEHYVP